METKQEQSDLATRDRPLNGFRTAKTLGAKAVVADILRQVESYEKYFSLRTRTRKAKDQETFLRQVEAVVSDLCYRELTNPRGWLAVPLSKDILGRKNRYKAKSLSETLPKLIDILSSRELDFLSLQSSVRNPFNPSLNKQTTIRASERLRERMNEHGITLTDFGKDKSAETILLKSGREDHWDKTKLLDYEDTPQTNFYREELAAINTWLANADVYYHEPEDAKAPIDDSDRTLYRVFNNGSFEQGGRLYGAFWIGLSKEQREHNLFIDGQPIVTLDYKSMAPRLLYGMAGVEPHFEDAYTIPGLEDHRPGVKLVMSAMLHRKTSLQKFPKGSKTLFPPKLKVSDVVQLIYSFHSPIAHYFCQDMGAKETYVESNLLITVLGRLRDAGIVGLPIHDAVIVPEGCKDQASNIMLSVFKETIGITGLLSIE